MTSSFDFRTALKREISSIVELDTVQLKKLENHFELLTRWNARINLSAIRDPVEIVRRHYGESLFLAAHLPQRVHALVDVGSGAGFPGIPVAIVRSDLAVTLLEVDRRKSAFLCEAARELSNVRVLAVRSSELTESFDVVTSRAVGLKTLLKDASRLAGRLEILTTLAQVQVLTTSRNFVVLRVIPLPWGDERVLVSAEQRFT